MKNLFVGNVDFNTTEDNLRELFAPYGVVNQVTIVRDRETGQSRGFAFVEMAAVADADKAIAELNGTQFRGRTLNVNEARPKPQREGGRRGISAEEADAGRRNRKGTVPGPNPKKPRPARLFPLRHHAKLETRTSRKIRDLATQNS